LALWAAVYDVTPPPVLAEALALDLNSVVNENPYFQKANKGQAGCQIALMIQSKFHTPDAIQGRRSRRQVFQVGKMGAWI
jgi:hypothetical protein